MLNLITDRSPANVSRRNELGKKLWSDMTAAEKAEWTGDPLLSLGGANLIPQGENYAAGVTVAYGSDSTTVTSMWDGSYIYAIIIIGPAANYVAKTMTFSVDSIYSSGGGSPQAALFWHDANGYEYAGASLTEAGSVTFTATENTGARENLALYLYATTDAAITAGAYIRYERLMLEMGSTKHNYAPYYEIVPTMATKGAYNYADLNRVEAAVAKLDEQANLGLVTKTNWTSWDIPRKADISRYLGNIAALRAWYPVPSDVPETPTSLENMTYETANNIEKILEAIAEALDMGNRSGELYAGEI